MKDIKGYEGLYAVTEDGRVWSYPRERSSTDGMFLSPATDKGGYLMVILRSPTKNVRIHRLIAETFIPNPENKATVNHKNGIKSDNRVENLEWATYKENARHAQDAGLHRIMYGEETSGAKLSKKKVEQIFLMRKNKIPVSKISKELGVHTTTIYRVLTGQSWRYTSSQ